jgi:nuclear receptor subfamily 1 group I
MKKEYIMSEEDKELKRMKIEQNRNKRKSKTLEHTLHEDVKPKKALRIKEEDFSISSPNVNSNSDENCQDDSDDPTNYIERFRVSSESSVTEIVTAIIEEPANASQIIQHVMKTQSEALSVMSRIVQEPSMALQLISHLIKYPSDGMLIISKMMSQSPLDALSVFTQFMSSPTDALHIIFKVMSSPSEVLKFMTELTRSPSNALEIMSSFMRSTSDTLQNVSRSLSDLKNSALNGGLESENGTDNEMIRSMLEVNSVDSPNSVPSPSSIQSAGTVNSPVNLHADSDSNNNDYEHMTRTILKEIAHDISGRKTPFKGNSIDSIINEAIKLEYNMPHNLAQMQHSSRELNDVELLKIQELLDANRALLHAPIEDEHISFLGMGEDSPIKVKYLI